MWPFSTLIFSAFITGILAQAVRHGHARKRRSPVGSLHELLEPRVDELVVIASTARPAGQKSDAHDASRAVSPWRAS